jgi:nicotinate-nucleotide adenylyltransferase
VAGHRRLGVMGGTFDPIHNGHLAAAREVARRLGLDEVVFIPAGHPWQKQDRDITDVEHRFRMVVIATQDEPGMSVSRIDIEREGPTYSVDTLRDLRAAHPHAELFFITGADALAGLPTWRDPQEVVSLAHLVGVTRPGYDLEAARLQAGLPEGVVTLLEIPGVEVSASECRERASSGESLDGLVPEAVANHIRDHGLYRD